LEEINPFYQNVAMYLRKSRAEEGEETEVVLARHRSQLTQFASANKINVTRVYEEVVSGDSLFSRPRMAELLHELESGSYTGVLCTDIDRLGRGNMKEQGLILETFKDAGAAIITPDKVYDLNNELDETQSEFKTFMARQELKMIKKRLSRGKQLTIEKGGYVANVPFGYVRAYKDKIPTLAPEPREAGIVRQIFEWYIDGDGCQTICHKLNAMGIKPHRGEEFTRNSIRQILMNPTYTGKIVWGKKKCIRPKKLGDTLKTVYLPQDQWQIIDGLHPPIIGEDMYKKAGALFRSHYHAPYRESGRIVNPLAGLLVCRKCGHMITRRTFNGKKHQSVHLICQTVGCVKSARADCIEQSFLQELELQLQALEIEQTESIGSSHRISDQAALERMRTEKSKLQKQREKLCDLLEQGVYTIPIFSEREKLLSEKIEQLMADIRSAEDELAAKSRRIGLPLPRINRVLQEYWAGTPAQKNKLLKSIVSRAYYFKSKDASPKEFTIDIELRKDIL
jgi:Site-specific recombinases, DNA invertase Pin homologs